MRVIFWDIEATDLSASWGRVLCTSFVELNEGKVYTYRGDLAPHKGRSTIDDSKLVKHVRNELEGADFIVGWNSILYDQPMLNARLAKYGERALRVGEKNGTRHVDLMYYAGGQTLRVGGRKLDTIAKYFDVAHQKTPLVGETWQLASVGNRHAMDQVVEHCEADVLVLRDLWPILAPNISKYQFPLGSVSHLMDQIPGKANV